MRSAFHTSDPFEPFFSGLDATFVAKLTELVDQNHEIRWVAFQHDGSVFQHGAGSKRWLIVTDQQPYTHGLPSACVSQLNALHAAGHEIRCVAFTVPTQQSPSGWSIVTDQTFVNSPNVPADCAQAMLSVVADGQTLLGVAFTGGDLFGADANRWTILTDKGATHHPSIPLAVRDALDALVAQGQQLRVVAYSQSWFWGDGVFSVVTDKGFFNTSVVPGAEVQQRMVAFTDCGWSVRTMAFSAERPLDYASWGYCVIGDVAVTPGREKIPPDVNVAGSAVIPVTPLLPVNYDVSLSVTNLTTSPTSLAMMLYGTTTGGWVDWMSDPFASGGMFDAKPPELGPSKVLTGPAMGPATTDCGAILVRTLAKGAGEPQLRLRAIAISRSGYGQPAVAQGDPPLVIGLWTNPVEAIRVWRESDGGPVTWLTLAGHLINTSLTDVKLTEVSLQLMSGQQVLSSASVPAWAWPLSVFGGDPPKYDALLPDAAGNVILAPGVSAFLQGMTLPDNFQAGGVALRARYVHDGRCHEAVWKGPLVRVQPVTIRPPVVGTWHWGNAPDHSSWDVHAWPGHRYSYDIGIVKDGLTYKGEKAEAEKDNSKFYCWNQPVYCVGDGVVEAADDKNADHLPWLDKPPPETNFVIVRHGTNRFSGYFHLRQDSLPTTGGHKLAAGDVVYAGDLIGRVGDSGGSGEPHLHFGYSEIDATGRIHLLPVRIEKMTTEDSHTVDVVPGNGTYVA